MDTQKGRRREAIFVVRMWLEPHEERPAWRALVSHVETQQRRYFVNYGELCDFLDRWRNGDG